MLMTQLKLRNRVGELGHKRYFGHVSITPFVSMEGNMPEDESNLTIPGEIKGGMFGLHDFFQGVNRYLWLEKKVTLPEKKEGCHVVGLFDFGVTGHGGNSGFESMLYVNGKPYQGVDTNHGEVFFTDLEGKETKLTFMLWTGLKGEFPGGIFYHQLQQADIAYLHQNADELYYMSSAIIETLDYMDPAAEQYDNLQTALDRAFALIDWDGEAFYQTVDEAYVCLVKELSRFEKHTDVTVNIVGHTHIDVAWLWRLKHTKEKTQRSFSTVLRLMERYPEYTFQQGQPQLYQYMKKYCPDIYEQMKERIAEGRWETDGGMWVEADCNLASGESLVRQILHGTRFFEQEFGKKCTYLWLPDVFGYSWALPQILKQCELDTFMTTKISWNQYNTIPHDLFWWRGIDGTEILTYFVDTPEVGHSFRDKYSTYNGLVSPRTVVGSWTKFKDKALSREVLISYGYGDGGGGPTRPMLEYGRVMDKLPGLPKVKQTRVGDFFKRIHESVEQTDRYVHTWDGELYLEAHRGTYTTQGYNKKMNRYLENKLTQIEWLASVAKLQGGIYDQDKLHDAWECLLLHQFHDIIPGSSIREVYEDCHVNYEEAERLIDSAKDTALATLVQEKQNTYTIYSANSFGGKELVFIPQTENGRFIDTEGNLLEAQRCAGGYEVLVDVKPFAVTTIDFQLNEYADSEVPFELTMNGIETPYYRIAWNDNGQLVTLFDKEANRSVLKEGQEGNVLEIYEDKPNDCDAWNIEIFAYEKMQKATLICKPEIVSCGALKAVVRFSYRYHLSTFTQDMIVYRDSKRIDFKTHADWHETHKLLKVAFYTDIRSTKATYDIQFGHVERPTHWNHSWDWAKFEVCGQKWADMSEEGYGVSLLNNCKYGHSIKDHVMRLSLLRSPKSPDREADMGEHDFTYSLYPHMGSVITGGTIEEANRLNFPAQVCNGAFKDNRTLIKVSSNQVQIDAIKKAEDEDCLVVRLHECHGGRVQVALTSDYFVKQLVPCNLLERDCGAAINEAEAVVTFNPFEIKSYKIYIKDNK